SKEYSSFSEDIVAFNELLLDDLEKQRGELNKVRASLQLDTPEFEEFDRVRESLNNIDHELKGFTTDLHNHLIRIVGLQARFQELLNDPVKKFIGLHSGTTAGAGASASGGSFNRAQSSMS